MSALGSHRFSARPASWLTNRTNYLQSSNHVFRKDDMTRDENCEWLHTLPRIQREDPQEKARATEERKLERARKHYENCLLEIQGILNFTFYQIDHRNNRVELSNARKKFQNGDFIPIPEQDDFDDAPTLREIVQAEARTCESYPCIKLFLTPTDISTHESFVALSRKILAFQYDPNPDLDHLLKLLHRQMAPYSEHIIVQKKRIPFPFFLNIIGPPCSGKSTILQFYQRYFDVDVLTVEFGTNPDNKDPTILFSTDEKTIVTAIIDHINQIKSESTGFVLANFPQNKQQYLLLDKAIQANGKTRKSAGQTSFLQVNGYIFTTLSLEDALGQSEGRLINESTGTIFHQTFRPVLPCTGTVDDIDEDMIVQVGCQKQFVNVFNEAASQISQFDQLAHKAAPSLDVELADHFWEVEQSLTAFAGQVSSQEMPELARFATASDFDFAIKNVHIYELWLHECFPLFGDVLGSEYARIVMMEKRMEELTQLAKERFYLETSRPDSRTRFIREQRSSRHFTREIWQKANDVRDEHLGLVDQIITESPINSFPAVLGDNESIVFEYLIKRWLVVDWFVNTYGPFIERKVINLRDNLPSPSIPEFDKQDLPGLIKIMNVMFDKSKKAVTKALGRILPTKSMPLHHIKPIIPITLKEDVIESNAPSDPHFPFDTRLEFGVKTRRKKSHSTQENIELFWDYVHTETSRKSMKQEAKVLGKMFDFFELEKDRIEKKVEDVEEQVRNDLYDWVFTKSSNEMAEFTQRKKEITDTFPMDTSCLTGRCKELFDALGGVLPSWGEIPQFDVQKLEAIKATIWQRNNSQYVELSTLLELAHEVDLEEKQCLQLEVLARLNELPLYIDIESFFPLIIDGQE